MHEFRHHAIEFIHYHFMLPNTVFHIVEAAIALVVELIHHLPYLGQVHLGIIKMKKALNAITMIYGQGF